MIIVSVMCKVSDFGDIYVKTSCQFKFNEIFAVLGSLVKLLKVILQEYLHSIRISWILITLVTEESV